MQMRRYGARSSTKATAFYSFGGSRATVTELEAHSKELDAYMANLEKTDRQQAGEVARADFARQKDMLGVVKAEPVRLGQRDMRRRVSRISKRANALKRKLKLKTRLKQPKRRSR